MTIALHNLRPNEGATKKKKRVGRGPGSGRGKTATRGQKGQKARTGHHGARVGFEGGQMPMQRRLPKRGFKNPFRVEAHAVNVADLERRFDAGATVDIAALRAVGLVPKKADVIKILGSGELTKSLKVEAHRFSKSAAQKIEGAGGSAVVLGAPAAATPEPAAQPEADVDEQE